MRYDLTYEGVRKREELANSIQDPLPPTSTAAWNQLANMRRLWILDQYLKGKTDPMTGPVMGPIFHKLVQEGLIQEET